MIKMKQNEVEWIGEISEDWEVKPLTALFSFGKGLSITKEDLKENGIPVLSYGQIHSKTNTGTNIQDDLLRYVDESFLVSNPQSLVQRGDFIFADTSEDLDGCGNCAYVNYFDSKLFSGYHTVIFNVTYSGFCIHLRNKEPQKINSKFLLYFFRSDYFRNELQRLSQGSNISNINQDLLSHIKIPLVDIRFQESVVDFLNKKCTAIDTVIEQKQNLIEKLTEYKKSLIYECVTGKKEI